MKLKNILMTAAIALVGVASANAALTYTGGDLLIGFHTTSEEVVFDLGSYATFAPGAATYTHDISADLSSAFGTWNSSTAIQWGVIGTTTALGSTTAVVVGKSEVTTGTPVTGFNNLSPANSQKVYNGAYDIYNQIGNPTTGSYDYDTAFSNGYYTAVNSSTSPLFTNLANGTATGYVGSSFGVGFDSGNFQANSGALYAAKTLSNTAVDLFLLNNSGTGTGTLQGAFTVTNAGVLTFNSVAAVPEPSTYAMMGIGAIGFLTMFRRRSIKA